MGLIEDDAADDGADDAADDQRQTDPAGALLLPGEVIDDHLFQQRRHGVVDAGVDAVRHRQQQEIPVGAQTTQRLAKVRRLRSALRQTR